MVGINEELLGITVKFLGITASLVGISRYYRGIGRYYQGIGRNDMIYTSGKVFIYRSQIDELLMSEYLDTNHVDIFGIFLVEKSQMCPGLYLPFLFVSSFHLTLLVGNLKTKVWDFYDSLPKKTHRAILPEVISHLYEDTINSFDTDIRGWRIQKIKQAPTQKNSVDCGMYICKYMEAAIQPEAVVWTDVKDWQENMAKFRAEFAYAILSTTIK
ncbi:hypothetical protein IEQ34_003542 [Dendrobium chrysotoxum]|uniref:Ubiquitin-like protease family profile domain-containing protein n=1 Tax=Dendrobium chrysotoxum TaxID=161865 RepID=A0AAV7H431_DENCH|nr:hypothetical protein IEQ34_003542 [Dendrobium chrysotoxum]